MFSFSETPAIKTQKESLKNDVKQLRVEGTTPENIF